MGGYQFPDVDKDAILKAAKLKALAKKLKKEGKKITPPPEPKMGVDAMDPDGAYQVTFSTPMMAPKGVVDQKIYGSAFGFGVSSLINDSKVEGAFG